MEGVTVGKLGLWGKGTEAEIAVYSGDGSNMDGMELEASTWGIYK
jgi:hypothetical protein